MKVEVGMKAKGFKFEAREYLGYSPNMDKYIDKIGVIEIIDDRIFSIRFEDDEYWNYPISLAHRSLLSVGDKVKIPKTKSVGDTIEDIELYENNMKTIKKSELKKIHDVACSTWKGKITALANRNPWVDDIELSEGEVDEMFASATSGQKVVLEEVFGKQNKEIDIRSEDISFKVDGIPLFGGSILDSTKAFISLPIASREKNIFYLNKNYNWELDGNQLKVTRK